MPIANLLSTKREREREAQIRRIVTESSTIPSGVFSVGELWSLFCARGVLGSGGAGLSDSDLNLLEKRISAIKAATK